MINVEDDKLDKSRRHAMLKMDFKLLFSEKQNVFI